MKLKCLLPLLFVFAPYSLASEAEVAADQSLVKLNTWHFSVAMGYGVKTNPLHSGDNFPLILVPSVKYYGEQIYFDNGDLGYTFNETESYNLSLVAKLNREFAHFVDWHPTNILGSVSFSSGHSLSVSSDNLDQTISELEKIAGEGDFVTNPGNGDPIDAPADSKNYKLSFAELSKRQWSIDLGLQANWYFAQQSQLSLGIYTDVFNRHGGQNINLNLSHYSYYFNRWKVRYKLGIEWLSSDLVNYYYGVSAADKVHSDYYYQAKSAVLPYVSISPSYPISSSWQILGSFSYQKLDESIKSSPIVIKDNRMTLFAGVNYVF